MPSLLRSSRLLLIVCLLTPFASTGFWCASKSSLTPAQMNDYQLRALAHEIAQETIITDGHIDVPYRMERRPADISGYTYSGDFDFPRCVEGGLNAPFMSIYTPATLEAEGGSYDLANKLIDMVEGWERNHPDKFRVVTSPSQAEQAYADGVVALPLGMENGSPIEGSLDKLRHFHGRGIRYITLTHSKDNHICDSSYDTTGTWSGLSPFGREVVEEMNQLGIMIDISHLSDNAAWQVLELTKKPVIASHSSCRKFIPGFERNMSDDMIRAVGKNGGVVQINFGSTFVSKRARDWGDAHRAAVTKFMAENGVPSDDPATEAFRQEYRKNSPFPFATVATVADHIDHVVKLAGVDHVGFGSDYDGVGPTLPTGLKDVSTFPNLIFELLKRGYSREDIEKICYKNVWRVWREVERT